METTIFTLDRAKSVVDQEMQRIFDTVPYTHAFHTARAFDRGYYQRHILECVLRIHLNNDLDAYAVSRIASSDPMLAKQLSYYLYDELGHDNFFINDLNSMGVSGEEIAAASTFFSTKLLMGYLFFEVEKEGALPAVMWDWFVEYYGLKYNPGITANAEKNLGRLATKGASTHVGTDQTEDHPALMFKMVKRAVRSESDARKAEEYLRRSIQLVGMYFQELFEMTQPQ